MSRPVRLLVVDDSATIRALIRSALANDARIEIVGEAADPYEAREKIKVLNPDVITLDIEMPRMPGLEFLEKIMRLRPMPVVMLSSLTQKGAAQTIEALALGAFDCIAKPQSGDFGPTFAHLADTVCLAARARTTVDRASDGPEKTTSDFKPNGNIVAIGASTGGVEALLSLLKKYPVNCPPTLITQHMPEAFLRSFAQRLDRTVAPSVRIAQPDEKLCKGDVLIAPGGVRHMQIAGRYTKRVELIEGPAVSGHIPSVDVLFQSVANCAGAKAVGVILTGLGRDGAKGLKSMREKGAATIGQSERSCVVYGMPKAAKELGAVVQELHLNQICDAILASSRAGD